MAIPIHTDHRQIIQNGFEGLATKLARPAGNVVRFHADALCPISRNDDMADAARSDALELLEKMQRCRAAGRPSDVLDQLPSDEAVLRGVAQVLDTTGVEAYNSDDMERAHDAFYLLFACRLRIVERHPDVREDIRDFATAEDLLGAVMIDLGNLDAADKLVPESLRYREGLHRDDPSDAHASYLYGQSLWRMAALSLAKSDPEGEADLVRQASAHMAHVDATWPGSRFIEGLRREIDERLAVIERAKT